jgi:hypothetical protein
MNEKQFVWWLTGFINCMKVNNRPTPNEAEWCEIKDQAEMVLCNIIEEEMDESISM